MQNSLGNLIVEPSLSLPRILAVDLGKKGGMVWNTSETGAFMSVAKMPEDIFERASLIKSVVPDIIVAENVRIWAGFDIAAGATFMIGRGFLDGVAATMRIKVDYIEPLSWIECYTMKRQKNFTKLSKGREVSDKAAWKNHLLELAHKLDSTLVNEITLDTCDALLIWNFIARKLANPMKKIGLIV